MTIQNIPWLHDREISLKMVELWNFEAKALVKIPPFFSHENAPSLCEILDKIKRIWIICILLYEVQLCSTGGYFSHGSTEFKGHIRIPTKISIHWQHWQFFVCQFCLISLPPNFEAEGVFVRCNGNECGLKLPILKCLGIFARHLGKVKTIPCEIKSYSIIQFKVCV